MSELTSKVNALLQRAIDEGQIAGANLLIMKDGKELVYTEAGYANVEKKVPFGRDTICRIYSMSKPVTAVAAMILMERGQLELGQPVGDILDSFKDMHVWDKLKKVSASRSLLVKDLLCMTSGLSYGGEDLAGQEVWRVLEELDARLYSEHPMSTEEFAGRIGSCNLSFHPGAEWEYGTSADILGAVIQKITGMPYGDFLKKEIFEPLGMCDTGFYVPEEKKHRLADVYEMTPNGMRLYETNHLGIRYNGVGAPAFESGGAGLLSTVDDYSKLASMLLQGGTYNGVQILKPKTVEFMTTAKLTPWQQESAWKKWESLYGYTYGNLMRVMMEPGMAQFNTWKGEYGWDGWLGTYFINNPSNNTTILLMCQRRDAGTMDVTKRLRNVIAANLD